MTQPGFDAARHKWRSVVADPQLSCPIRHDYTILGYDPAARTLDMVVRWAGDGGHCPIHRHTATTSILVLEGEQHLWDLNPDRSRGDHRVRRVGDYALTNGEVLPHLERGGPDGGVVFFGNHSPDGRLYEILDEDLNVVIDLTMEELFADWEANAQ